jgi:ABC-type multidrug transport system ATPase subunit
VALMQSGKIMSIDTPDGIIEKFEKDLFAVRSSKMLSLLNDLKNFEEVEDAYFFGAYHHVVMKHKNKEDMLKNYLLKYAADDLEIKAVRPNIEDCFMALMKN